MGYCIIIHESGRFKEGIAPCPLRLFLTARLTDNSGRSESRLSNKGNMMKDPGAQSRRARAEATTTARALMTLAELEIPAAPIRRPVLLVPFELPVPAIRPPGATGGLLPDLPPGCGGPDGE